jgi:hypothetical protein
MVKQRKVLAENTFALDCNAIRFDAARLSLDVARKHTNRDTNMLM